MSQKCSKCNRKFRSHRDLESHFDEHTPLWSRKKVTLSGADQICLVLKDIHGGWRKYFNLLEKRKNYDDLLRAKKIKEFEKQNQLSFVVCGAEVRNFRSLQ